MLNIRWFKVGGLIFVQIGRFTMSFSVSRDMPRWVHDKQQEGR